MYQNRYVLLDCFFLKIKVYVIYLKKNVLIMEKVLFFFKDILKEKIFF